METRIEKDRADAFYSMIIDYAMFDMAIPRFESESCENCYESYHKEDNELIHLNHHVYLHGVHTVVTYSVCSNCIEEVIQYRCRCRNVSDMTEELLTQK